MKSATISFLLFVACIFTSQAQINLQQGLVGYYAFSGNANDSSTLAINGTVYGATLTNGINNASNSAYSFIAANNNYIDLGTTNRGITNRVTVSLWLKTTSSAQQYPFTKYEPLANKGYLIGMLNGQVWFGGRDGNNSFITTGYSATAINDGQWHHVMGVVDANSWELYIDCNLAAQVTTSSVSVNLANGDVMAIGRWYTGDPNGNHFPFTGSIDEVRIYNRRLTSFEVSLLCNTSSAQIDLQQGLVGFYPFLDNANDWSTLGIDGTIYGATVTNGINNEINSAYSFIAANNNYIDFGTTNRGITNRVTVSLWLKTTSSAQQYPFTKYEPAADHGFLVGMLNGQVWFGGRDGNNSFITTGYSAIAINDGQWHHVLGVVDANSWKLYIDCNLAAQITTSSTSVNLANGDVMTIGRWYTGDPNGNHFPFTGSIDELRIYNRVLTDDELQILCNPATAHGDWLLATPSSTPETCGQSDGTASVAVTGGSGNYSYQWSPVSGTDSVLTGLTYGTYSVTVTDDSTGSTATATVEVPYKYQTTSTLSSTRVCLGQPTQFTLANNDSLVSWVYTFSNGNTSTQQNPTQTFVYCPPFDNWASVVVTNAHGCKDTLTEHAVVNCPVYANYYGRAITKCAGDCKGTASINVTQGTPPYSIQWSDPRHQSTATASNLCAGTYTVSITDANGCSASLPPIEVYSPAEFTGTFTTYDIPCFGEANGTAVLYLNGGTPPYSYSWNDASHSTTQSVTGVSAGNYCVTATDVRGCVFDSCITITQQPAISVTPSVVSASCGVCNGSASVMVTGGTLPYAYSWSSGSSASNATGLCAGVYYVSLTDANGCLRSVTIGVSNAGGPSVTVTPTNVSCNGGCNGAASATVGTCPSCTFGWFNESGASIGASSSIANLCAGNYSLIVTNPTSGCQTAKSFSVTQPPALIIITSAADVSAIGSCDGSVSVTATGSVSPYTYQWADSQYAPISGATSATLSNLCKGRYYVRVTDAGNCQSLWASAEVGEPLGLTITAESVTTTVGAQVVVPVTVQSFQNIAGAQGTIEFDPQVIAFVQAEQFGLPGLSSSNFGTSQANSGILSFIWDDPSTLGVSLPDGSIIFAIRFNVTGNAGQQSSVDFVNSPTVLEIIDPQANPINATFVSGVVTIEPPLDVTGFVRTENGQPVSAATMSLSGTTTQSTTTAADGSYALSISQPGSYTITPSKNNDVADNNGITTADILLIRRHILGTLLLSSPYKIIAADVNASSSVTTQDVLLIRALILNNNSTFPNGRLWSFVPANHVFSNPANPFPFPSRLSYANISTDLSDQNFTGIKLGDVNNTWDHNIAKTATAGAVHFMMEEKQVVPGAEVVIPVKVKDFRNVAGYQFTLSWNPEVLSLVEVSNKTLHGFYGMSKVAEGFLTTSWNDDAAHEVKLNDGETVFELKFWATGTSATFTEIKIGSELTPAEAYNGSIEVLSVTSVNGMVKVEYVNSPNTQHSTLNTLCIHPNPFSSSAIIVFSIPQDETVSIEIYDIMGREIKKIAADYKAGVHTMEWNGNDANGNRQSGLYYVRMKAGEYSKVTEVIFLE